MHEAKPHWPLSVLISQPRFAPHQTPSTAKVPSSLVVSGLRTADEQNALYAQGRTTPGHIVTNAKAGYSMHNYGLAIDMVPYLTGSGGALNWTASTPQFQRMVGAMKAQGLEWGGDWKGALGDYDHFQLTDLPSSPSATMRADYGTGPATLDAIWGRATEGSYAV